MKRNLPVTNRENDYPDSVTIISTTDTKGIITYANQGFIDVAGFSEEELIGRNHNIVRHPDMPPAAFQHLWDTIKAGQPWRGIVKNRCKNGDHYWVDAYVTPVYEGGRLVGYQSVRSKPGRKEIEAAEALYQAINAGRVKKLPKGGGGGLGVGARLVGALLLLALFLAAATGVGGYVLKSEAAAQAAYRQRVAGQVEALKQEALAGGLSPTQLRARFGAAERSLGVAAGTEAMPGWVLPVLGALALAGFLIALLTIRMSRRRLLKPLASSIEVAKAIAGGDLTQSIEVHGTDEFGQMLLAIKMMQARLQTLIGQISEFSHRLLDDAKNVSTVAVESNQHTHGQRDAVAAISEAMEEMNAALQEVAGHAHDAAEAAAGADEGASRGKAVVEGVMGSISALANEVQRAGGVIHELEAQSDQIGAILDVIRGIADQTNLLALNAAIEAARAGEQGRGFAVVADEVRNLAQRTQDSTEEIHQMIEQLQSQSQGAVAVMSGSQEQAQGSVGRAAEAGTALDEITATIARINELNSRISVAHRHQEEASARIAERLGGIAESAEITAGGADETARCCEHLAEQTERLNRVVGQFRL